MCRSLRRPQSRAKQGLPQALQALCVFSRSRPRSARAVRPSAASARSYRLGRKRNLSPRSSTARSQSKRHAASHSPCIDRNSLASSLSSHPRLQFKHSFSSLRFQRWYASPSKYKARLRLQERGLTLPSSGPAFGSPLKSNVSRQLQCSTMPLRSFTSVRFVIQSSRSVKASPFVGSIAGDIESPLISAAQMSPVLAAYWQQQ